MVETENRLELIITNIDFYCNSYAFQVISNTLELSVNIQLK